MEWTIESYTSGKNLNQIVSIVSRKNAYKYEKTKKCQDGQMMIQR